MDYTKELFVIILDTINTSFRKGIPWELLFTDDLVIAMETEDELQRIWLVWQEDLKVNTSKTEVMASCKKTVKLEITDLCGTKLKQVDKFMSEESTPKKIWRLRERGHVAGHKRDGWRM